MNLRMSERRLNKLRLYAAGRDKTMTSIIEDFIDSLPQQEINNKVLCKLRRTQNVVIFS